MRAASNLAIDIGRRQVRSPFVDTDADMFDIADDAPAPDEVWLSNKRNEALAAAFAALDPLTREMLRAQRLEGLRVDEDPRYHGLTKSAVEKTGEGHAVPPPNGWKNHDRARSSACAARTRSRGGRAMDRAAPPSPRGSDAAIRLRTMACRTSRPSHRLRQGDRRVAWPGDGGEPATPSAGRAMRSRPKSALSLSRRYSWAAALAACLVLIVAAGQFLSTGYPVYATVVGEQRSIRLADLRTRVMLNTDTRISVDYDAARRRVVLERGEALFDVALIPRGRSTSNPAATISARSPALVPLPNSLRPR